MLAASGEGLQALLTAEFAALGRARIAPRHELVDEELDELEDPELGAERRGDLREVHAVIEPGPCENCAQARRCAQQLLACSVFAEFVAHGGADAWPEILRSPSRGVFERIFRRNARDR